MRLPNFKVDRFEARTTDFLASAWVFHEFPVSLPIEMESEDSQGIETVSVLLVDIVELSFSFWIVQEAPGCFVIFIGVSLSLFSACLADCKRFAWEKDEPDTFLGATTA